MAILGFIFSRYVLLPTTTTIMHSDQKFLCWRNWKKFKVNLTTWHIGKNCILWIQGMLPFFLIPLLKNWLVKNWTIPEKSVFKDNSPHFHFLEWYSNFCWGLYLKDPYWVLIATQYSFEHVCIAKTFAKNSE